MAVALSGRPMCVLGGGGCIDLHLGHAILIVPKSKFSFVEAEAMRGRY